MELNIHQNEHFIKINCFFAGREDVKKVFTIVILAIMLISGMQISIDRHYCGGKFAGSKISVTGQLASCGMGNHERRRSQQPSIDKRCCEDKISFYSISSNYFPGDFRLSYPDKGKEVAQFPFLNILLRSTSETDLISWVLPPGDRLKSAFTLSEICVFRI